MSRDEEAAKIFQYDARKSKKLSCMASLLIEYLTEESNGFMTAGEIKKKLKRILNVNIHKSTVAKHRKKVLR